MTAAKQGIQVNVEKDLSTATIGGAKVEVSTDSNVVVYTNDGVQTKPTSEAAAKGTHISEDFNTVVLNGATIERAADGHLIISTPGIVITKPGPANDAAPAKTGLNKGDPAPAGDEEHKGFTYAGIPPGDDKALWVSRAPKLMDHYAAAAWASAQGGTLPNRAQGDYLDTVKNQGALKGIFNDRSGSFPAGYVWLAEPITLDSIGAWCQRLSDGDQYYSNRNLELPVLCVRR